MINPIIINIHPATFILILVWDKIAPQIIIIIPFNISAERNYYNLLLGIFKASS